jgi:hypothetical protein
MHTQLSVRPGVYFAAVQGEGVILDLIEDRYYGLSAESARLWHQLVEGRAAEPIDADLAARQMDVWRQCKLVTASAAASASAEIAAHLPVLKPIGEPAQVGLDQERIASTGFSVLALWQLTRANNCSQRAMTQRGLSWTLQRIQRIPAPSSPSAKVDHVLHQMMRVYRSSRRLASQGKDDCLPRSLALVMALRRLGVDAEICFGVQKFPFLAHAWVEAGGRAINETPDAVQRYTLLARF